MPPEQHQHTGNPMTVCPACDGRLVPRELACKDCGLVVQMRFAGNEFTRLDDDSLHLLRILVACEGRIRDMERALGVSYPTVKSRLRGLQSALGVARAEVETPQAPADEQPRRANERPGDVLARLEAGEIDFEAAMRSIRNL